MTAATLVRDAMDAGVELNLIDGKLKAVGPPAAVQSWAPKLREHRAELLELLAEARETTAELLAAAMRCCDHHGDGQQARAQMRADCEATPLHLRADLLAHFTATYPKAKQ